MPFDREFLSKFEKYDIKDTIERRRDLIARLSGRCKTKLTSSTGMTVYCSRFSPEDIFILVEEIGCSIDINNIFCTIKIHKNNWNNFITNYVNYELKPDYIL